LLDGLKRQAERLGLRARCEFAGARPQEEVIAAYRAADLFALPCRIDATGDRDGLPNAIVEAQLLGLPVVSTPIPGVTELVEDGVNGLLVPPDDAKALAAAIIRLAADPAMRVTFGTAGSARVRARLDHKAAIGELIGLIRDTLAGGRAERA
jgi:glycosyltransferase involved in cell wall biosynthesis